MEEIRLNLKERKMRTRLLITLGGLVVKAGLEDLPTNTLYGALQSIAEDIKKHPAHLDKYTALGKAILDKEATEKTPIILKLTEKPSLEIRSHIRSHGLKWNALRSEWYGYCDTKSLQEAVMALGYQWTSPPMLLGESTSLNKERDGQNMKYIVLSTESGV
jgi:hypothetical protein